MTQSRLSAVFVLLSALPCSPIFAQNLIVNGSFEQGLAHWSFQQVNEPSASGTCSYNATTAPGTETLTGTPGFPATDGTHIALGSVASTSGATGTGARTNCTLYQDVPIPPGVSGLTLKFDAGLKAGNDGCGHSGGFIGVYSTLAVPGVDSIVQTGFSSLCEGTPDATLTTQMNPVDPNTIGGTTLRVAFINAADGNGHEVIGIDNVQLLPTYAPPTVTSVTPTSGPAAGGNTVTITGTNLTGATSVNFGGVAAASFTVVSATSITAVVPGGGSGAVSVIVTTPNGSNAANSLYSYVIPTPTLNEWGMLGLGGLLIFYAWRKLRQDGRIETA